MFAFFNLKAINPLQDINRFYAIRVDKTLFEEYLLQIVHGRTGFKGRTRNYYFKEAQPLSLQLEKTLKKRFNATSRLGTNYVLLTQNYDQSFAQEILEKFKNPLLIDRLSQT